MKRRRIFLALLGSSWITNTCSSVCTVSITYVMRQKRSRNNSLKTEPCLWMRDLKSMLQHRCTCTPTDVTNRTWRYSKRLCVNCSTSGGSGDVSSIFIYVSDLTSHLIQHRVFLIRLLPINIIHLLILGLAQRKDSFLCDRAIPWKYSSKVKAEILPSAIKKPSKLFFVSKFLKIKILRCKYGEHAASSLLHQNPP